MMNQNACFNAYVAGLVDGEGCFTIERSRRFYYPRFYIGMSTRALPILEKIVNIYGGSVKHHRKKTDKWAAAVMYSSSGQDLHQIAQAILPHLHLKREQCELIIRLHTMIHERDGKSYGLKWDEEFTATVEQMKQQMNLLNRKGD